MAIKTVTIEESCNPQGANIFSRTQDLRAATSEIEEAMFNLLFRLAHHQEAVLHLAVRRKTHCMVIHKDSVAKNLEMNQ